MKKIFSALLLVGLMIWMAHAQAGGSSEPGKADSLKMSVRAADSLLADSLLIEREKAETKQKERERIKGEQERIEYNRKVDLELKRWPSPKGKPSRIAVKGYFEGDQLVVYFSVYDAEDNPLRCGGYLTVSSLVGGIAAGVEKAVKKRPNPLFCGKIEANNFRLYKVGVGVFASTKLICLKRFNLDVEPLKTDLVAYQWCALYDYAPDEYGNRPYFGVWVEFTPSSFVIPLNGFDEISVTK